mgnify:CR=1 FL=1
MNVLDIALFGVPLIPTVVAAGAFVLWISMLADAVDREFETKKAKWIWIIVIAVLQALGALLYYFALKRKDK